MKNFSVTFVACTLVIIGSVSRAHSQDTPKPARAATSRNGSHDFDFEIGTWKTHLWSLRRPLTDSTEWVESKGIVVVRGVWNGRANLVELVAEGPAGPFEFLNLRLYNAQTQQWSDYFATSKDGTFMKPMIGEFKNGRGEPRIRVVSKTHSQTMGARLGK